MIPGTTRRVREHHQNGRRFAVSPGRRRSTARRWPRVPSRLHCGGVAGAVGWLGQPAVAARRAGAPAGARPRMPWPGRKPNGARGARWWGRAGTRDRPGAAADPRPHPAPGPPGRGRSRRERRGHRRCRGGAAHHGGPRPARGRASVPIGWTRASAPAPARPRGGPSPVPPHRRAGRGGRCGGWPTNCCAWRWSRPARTSRCGGPDRTHAQPVAEGTVVPHGSGCRRRLAPGRRARCLHPPRRPRASAGLPG